MPFQLAIMMARGHAGFHQLGNENGARNHADPVVFRQLEEMPYSMCSRR